MSSTDPDLTEDERAKRIEELLYIIGGAEVVIRSNQAGKFGGVPNLARAAKEYQQKNLKKLERVMNGLPED